MTSVVNEVGNEEAISAFASALAGAQSVVVIGGYGCGNTGDEAILSVLVNEPAIADRDVTVISRDPRGTTQLHGVQTMAARPSDLLRAVAASDAVVIGGGGIFSGYMGRRSMLLPMLALSATAMRKRVLFRAVGVYQSTPRLVGGMLAAAMERSSFVSVRDEPSITALRGFGLQRPPILEDDPALRLRSEPFHGELRPRSVGLALRRVRDHAMQRRLTRTYAALMSSLAADGCVPVLVPFCEHPSEPVEQDASFLRRLRDFSGVSSAVVLDALPPAQLLSAVGSLDSLVAMRFHAIVFGHLAGTPTLALEYDEKCAAFAAKHSIPSFGLADVSIARLSKSVTESLSNEIAA